MWWDQSIVKSLSYLFYLRVSLFDNLNEGDTFRSEKVTSPISCPFATQTARTYDGTCNRNNSNEMGRANSRFGRLSGFNYSVSNEDDLLIPNPKVVADTLLYRKDGKMIEENHVNLLAAAWIQFQTHDWFTHLNDGPEENPIQVPLADGTTMKVPRTQKDPSWDPSSGTPQTYINSQTTWWDLSQIYGQSKHFSDSMRSFQSGKIKMDENNKIPINPSTGIEFAGVDNNWWAGLSMLHNLFTREHNSICDMLAKKYPEMSDEELFQKARLINAAVNAKIHTIEWTPTLLQDDILLLAMNANWAGLPGYKGIMGNEMDPFVANTTHQFPEEFVSAYRMHPMLPEKIDIKPLLFSRHKKITKSILDVAFDKGSKVVEEFGLADMFNTLGLAPQGKLTLQNYPDFFNGLDTPNHPGQTNPGQKLDLATIEIIRDRERGIPRYNAYRQSIGMEPFTSIANITQDPVHLKALMEVYGGDINKVDLLVGTLAEQTRPPGFGFSDTTFRVFIAIASRRLMADRFFTNDYNEETYTKEGLAWIKAATMKNVITRNIPELRIPLAAVANPFIPWMNVPAQAYWLHLYAKSARDLVKIGVDVVVGAMTGKEVLPK